MCMPGFDEEGLQLEDFWDISLTVPAKEVPARHQPLYKKISISRFTNNDGLTDPARFALPLPSEEGTT